MAHFEMAPSVIESAREGTLTTFSPPSPFELKKKKYDKSSEIVVSNIL